MFKGTPPGYSETDMVKFYRLLLVSFSLLPVGCAGDSPFQKGQTLYNSGRYLEAIYQWEKVPPQDKNYLQAQLRISQTKRELDQKDTLYTQYIRRGERLEKTEDLPGAIEMYEKAIQVAPYQKNQLSQKITQLTAKKQALLEQAFRSGEDFFKNKDYQNAKAQWKKVLRLDPSHTQARQRLKEIDGIENSNDQVFYRRGVELYRQKLLNAAKREFEKALSLNPNNPDAAQYLEAISKVQSVPYRVKKGDTLIGIAKTQMGKAEDVKILADFNHLSVTSPVKPGEILHIPSFQDFKAVALKEESRRGVQESPVETMAKEEPMPKEENPMKEEGPKTPDLSEQIQKILERGRSYKEQGEYAEAIAEFEKILNLDPHHPQAQAYLEETREALQKQIAFHLNQGIQYFNDQELEKAIAEWDKVLALNPDNPKARDYQKRAYALLEKLRALQDSKNQSP
jgi:tetratricopeptide (TPR) repeat protein